MKYSILPVIFLFALIILAMPATGDNDNAKNEQPVKVKNDTLVSPDSTIANNKIIAYYFHGNRRCKSCRAIEDYSIKAIENGFPDRLKKGQLAVEILNFDKEENKHFKDDFQLYTSSLVIVRIDDGQQSQWKNLKDVWKLKGDKVAFAKYVQKEIAGLIEGNNAKVVKEEKEEK